jgi:hypothetical protein
LVNENMARQRNPTTNMIGKKETIKDKEDD